METMLLVLLSVAIVLLILSFFLKDPYKEIKTELDQFSMQQIQEIYQIKRKIKILEEELLIDDSEFTTLNSFVPQAKREIHAIIKNQVWTLYQQGTSIEQIAKQSSLTSEEVNEIIAEFSLGDNYE